MPSFSPTTPPAEPPNLPEIPDVPQMPDWSRWDPNQVDPSWLPTRGEYVETLAQLDLAGGVILLVFGLIYLLLGWRVFKALVILNAAVAGAALGIYAGALLGGGSWTWLGAVAGAGLLAVLAVPLMRYAVGLMGAAAGALVGLSTWSYVTDLAGREDLTAHAWIGALIGLVVVGLLCVALFRFLITLFTSVQGAGMIVSGSAAILMKIDALRQPVADRLAGNPHLLIWLVAVPAVAGVIYQETASARRRRRLLKEQLRRELNAH